MTRNVCDPFEGTTKKMHMLRQRTDTPERKTTLFFYNLQKSNRKAQVED